MAITAPAPKRGYSTSEAVNYTGCTRTRIYEDVAEGRLPSFKIGRRRMFLREDLDKYLEGLATEATH